MPKGDTIFQRLREATDSELRGVARALEVELTGERDLDVVTLSKQLRSTGGNSFANVFRDDHDLTYRAILVDVARAAAEIAGFKPQAPGETARETWIEDYILHAMAHASRPDRSTLPADEVADAQRRADAALNGRTENAGIDRTDAARLGVLALGAVGVAVGVGALPFAAVFMALKWARPAVKKTLPATLCLISVRKRREAEEALREHEDQA